MDEKGKRGLYKALDTALGEREFTLQQTEYLVKTALSFLASMVSRMVSFPAPVVMVSVVTVSLDVDSVFPSSSSLSELLDDEVSDATSGAFLATHTLHTHAVDNDFI